MRFFFEVGVFTPSSNSKWMHWWSVVCTGFVALSTVGRPGVQGLQVGSKGSFCNTTTSCGTLFCNYPPTNIPNCAWKWSNAQQINFLCITSMTQGVCQECPPGLTASGAYCVECRKGKSCDRSGVERCEGQCAAGNFPTCDPVTGWSVCAPCTVNQALLNAGHRRLTRGGVLDQPDLCDTYFQCDVGYYLTSNANSTGVTCEVCQFPEASQQGFVAVSRGLTFGDKFSCIYRAPLPAPLAANGIGQYGAPFKANETASALSSCPLGYTSVPGMAPTSTGCIACPNPPRTGGSFAATRFDCTVTCDSTGGYEQRGEQCRPYPPGCDEEGYIQLPGGVCSPSPLPWSRPGNTDSGGGVSVSVPAKRAKNIIALDPVSGYYATDSGLYDSSDVSLCSNIQSVAENVGYVQDLPLFTSVCGEKEMHVHYMALKADQFMYLFLERTFGNNNRYVMWQIQTRVDGTNRGVRGQVWQTWRLPGKACSAAWSRLETGADHIFLALCDAPFLVYVRALDYTDNIQDPATDIIKTQAQYVIGRKFDILIGQDKVGKSDGMRDVALFGASLSVANTSDPKRLMVADRDNCRIVEVVIDEPGSFLTRATTIGTASCFAGAFPIPQPRNMTSVLGGRAHLFVTDLGLVHMDYKFRSLSLVLQSGSFPLQPKWLTVGENGSTVVFANETHHASVQRLQSTCPPFHESRRGSSCTPCAKGMFVSPATGSCTQCSPPACSALQAPVACSHNADTGCRDCTGTSQYSFRYGEECAIVLTTPCPTGYYEADPTGVSTRDCIPCPVTWSARAYDNVPQAGKCACFRQSAGASMDESTQTCVVRSPFTADAGPMPTPQWVRGFNCTFQDQGCHSKGCYLSRVFPRNCTECADGLYGENGMWCERCPGFRDPSPAKDSCLCRAPSRVTERDGSGTCVCPAGHGLTPEGTGCAICEAGKYQSSSIIMLDNFAEQSGGGCTECPSGFDSEAGATSCSACPAGTYKETGMARCTKCQLANYYPTSAKSRFSCTACRLLCPTGYRWTRCPVSDILFACEPCSTDTLPSSRYWVPGADNTNCLWACSTGYYELLSNCWECTRPTCPPGFALTECSRYEDAHCREPCVNATKPEENSEWTPDAQCHWRCKEGYSMRKKEFMGWVEYLCELPELAPWTNFW